MYYEAFAAESPRTSMPKRRGLLTKRHLKIMRLAAVASFLALLACQLPVLTLSQQQVGRLLSSSMHVP
jgi:hypothetical protein